MNKIIAALVIIGLTILIHSRDVGTHYSYKYKAWVSATDTIYDSINIPSKVY